MLRSAETQFRLRNLTGNSEGVAHTLKILQLYSLVVHVLTAIDNSRGGGTPYNGLYGEAPPERGAFFRLQVYKRVGISQV